MSKKIPATIFLEIGDVITETLGAVLFYECLNKD